LHTEAAGGSGPFCGGLIIPERQLPAQVAKKGFRIPRRLGTHEGQRRDFPEEGIPGIPFPSHAQKKAGSFGEKSPAGAQWRIHFTPVSNPIELKGFVRLLVVGGHWKNGD
jgi:hypothetical protein